MSVKECEIKNSTLVLCYNGADCPEQSSSDVTCKCWPGFSGKECEIDLRALWGITIATGILLVILSILVAVWFAMLWKRANELMPSELMPSKLSKRQQQQRYPYPLHDDVGPSMMPTGMVPGNQYATSLPGNYSMNDLGAPRDRREYDTNWEAAGAKGGPRFQSTDQLLNELKDRIRAYEDTFQTHNKAFSVDDERLYSRRYPPGLGNQCRH
ncbi:unnamed protein product [Owenia fusiformis]|uniref:EGF-like domain-containing protein n=2 Tax=Owenia fusiformis TaxID=6347 RepID=A0A8S4P4U4_OWEFU|nr:unnamed protein product [Owenia fusiformis]